MNEGGTTKYKIMNTKEERTNDQNTKKRVKKNN